MEPIQLAAILAATIVLASMLSVELGISAALLELGLGVIAGNLFGLDPNTDWLAFIAQFASIVLTFLAGAEVDPDDFRERFGASVAIGLVSFVGPFVVACLVAYGLLDWTLKASLIAGTALSTTSLAVVYAVLVESGLNQTRIGKLIMSACFVTDMGTAGVVGDLHQAQRLVPVFLAISIALIVALPKLAPWFFGRYGDRVIERRRVRVLDPVLRGLRRRSAPKRRHAAQLAVLAAYSPIATAPTAAIVIRTFTHRRRPAGRRRADACDGRPARGCSRRLRAHAAPSGAQQPSRSGSPTARAHSASRSCLRTTRRWSCRADRRSLRPYAALRCSAARCGPRNEPPKVPPGRRRTCVPPCAAWINRGSRVVAASHGRPPRLPRSCSRSASRRPRATDRHLCAPSRPDRSWSPTRDRAPSRHRRP